MTSLRIHRLEWTGVLMVLIFLGAVAVRLPRIDAAPGDLHPARQYNAALLARAFFIMESPFAPQWQKDVAAANLGMVQRGEPPVMEAVSARIYRWMGRESFFVPRSVALFSWLAGGFFLLAIARRFMTPAGRLTALAFYLFLPFGIVMSRSLQPDAMMVMGILASAFFTVRYFERPTPTRLFVAGLVAGLAILIKPGTSQFAILGLYLLLSLRESGVRNSLVTWRTYAFAALAVLPTLAYLLFCRVHGIPLGGFLQSNFVPRFFVTLYFWKGWLGLLLKIFGLPALAIGIAGLLFCVSGRGRLVGIGLGVGYLAQCFLTSYTTPSHDYWHLQAVPLMALGWGFAACRFSDWLRCRLPSRAARVVIGVILVTALAWSTRPALWVAEDGGSPGYERLAREVGEAVGHSPRVVILDSCYGRPLCYFAWISGWWWPETADLAAETLHGMTPVDAKERFARDYAPRAPEFFVVRNLIEFERQKDLKSFLEDEFVLLRNAERYRIYTLRRTGDGRHQEVETHARNME